MAVVLNPKTRIPENRPLYEVASTHIARRTMRALSGHAPSSQTFARYSEIDEEMRKAMVDVID